jgi:very-short-patch-repair endonuclease
MASNLEAKFLLYWRASNGTSLETEYRFCPERKWRSDFADVNAKCLFEIEGGQWIMGRHQRGSGFAKDAEKYNVASYLGWKVFRITPSMLTLDYVEDLIRICRGLAVSNRFISGKKI